MYFEKNEIRQIARCEECTEDIFDNSVDVYLDEEGNYFCCLDCALRYYGIKKSEDCWCCDE